METVPQAADTLYYKNDSDNQTGVSQVSRQAGPKGFSDRHYLSGKWNSKQYSSSMKKLLVLADDFSGACEIAGIISRYGRDAALQLVPDLESRADALVIDLDTRQPDVTLMEERMTAFTALLKNHPEEFTVFKKVDSVFRGHILKETVFLLEPLAVRRVFLLPANPETGRKINNGTYYVNGKKLHNTIFASDPHFPKTTSRIDDIIDYREIPLRHTHLNRNMHIPDAGLLTADISSTHDLDYYTSFADSRTLYCGGAQCFDAFVRNVLQWRKTKSSEKRIVLHGKHFFINGSTVKTDEEAALMGVYTIRRASLPGGLRDDRYRYDKASFDAWTTGLIDDATSDNLLCFHVDQPVRQLPSVSDSILKQLIHLADHLLHYAGNDTIHLLLTGGATASSILRSTGEQSLEVVREHVQGVVTVRSEHHSNRFFTVKPGSYPWPESLFKQLGAT